MSKNTPFYLPIEDEVEIFEKAWINQIPILLKGPTGCGKTRFVEYMSARIRNRLANSDINPASQNPGKLYTISCHEDLTTRDLVGRYIIKAGEAVWIDGPVTRAVKDGGLLYLDEVVEARKDVTVVIHPLTDHRRILPIESLGVELDIPKYFMLVMSYNPGYQVIRKNLKPSTKQRFIAINFSYPPPEKEVIIVQTESGVDLNISKKLVLLANNIRNLTQIDLEEGVSTRSIIYAAKLILSGINQQKACLTAILQALTDDHEDLSALIKISQKIL